MTSTDNIKLNNKIRFRTHNTHDNVVHSGTVTTICTYETAKKMGDIDAYYAEVKRTNPSMDPKEKLTYFIINYLDSADSNAVLQMCFAVEWVNIATLEVVVDDIYYDIRVFDITPETAEELRKNISAMGYTASVLV